MNITYSISILLYKSQNKIIIYRISKSKRHVLINPKSKQMSLTNRHNEKKRKEKTTNQSTYTIYTSQETKISSQVKTNFKLNHKSWTTRWNNVMK